MAFDPSTDGIDHINIYSKGKTELGRFLSNFAHTPIDLPEDGHVESVEGYWFWLGVPEDAPGRDALRGMHGYEAKKTGSELQRTYGRVHVPDFEERIEKAVETKLWTYPEKVERNYEVAKLPFTHYYAYGDRVVDMYPRYSWYVDATRRQVSNLMQEMAAGKSSEAEVLERREKMAEMLGFVSEGQDDYSSEYER